MLRTDVHLNNIQVLNGPEVETDLGECVPHGFRLLVKCHKEQRPVALRQCPHHGDPLGLDGEWFARPPQEIPEQPGHVGNERT